MTFPASVRRGMCYNGAMQTATRNPCVLYLSMIEGSPSQESKLAGIRRYCSTRGWDVVAVNREDATPENLKGLLRRHRPVGCVVEGVGRHADLPPRLFGGTPVSYIGYPRDLTAGRPNFNFDTDSIAKTAFRELSADNPACYAAVGHPRPWKWSRGRVRAFRLTVLASGAQCLAFPAIPLSRFESDEAFVLRLSKWIAKLPLHCAVFAVSDETALLVTRAARLARRPIPRSLALLSVDNFADICENADPPISSIQLDFEREGYMAAKTIGDEVSAAKGAKRGKASADSASLASKNDLIGPLLTVRRKSTSGRGRREKFVLKALEMIRAEACDGLTARKLLARFPVSKTLFNLRFREAVGHSVLDVILHVRLEQACTLLAQTDTAIGAVPALCGFRCDRTLDALFRARFGISMRDWRKRNAR